MLEGIELGGGDGGGGVGGKNGGVGESSLRTVNFGQTICESHNFSSRTHHFHAPNTLSRAKHTNNNTILGTSLLLVDQTKQLTKILRVLTTSQNLQKGSTLML